MAGITLSEKSYLLSKNWLGFLSFGPQSVPHCSKYHIAHQDFQVPGGLQSDHFHLQEWHSVEVSYLAQCHIPFPGGTHIRLHRSVKTQPSVFSLGQLCRALPAPDLQPL